MERVLTARPGREPEVVSHCVRMAAWAFAALMCVHAVCRAEVGDSRRVYVTVVDSVDDTPIAGAVVRTSRDSRVGVTNERGTTMLIVDAADSTGIWVMSIGYQSASAVIEPSSDSVRVSMLSKPISTLGVTVAAYAEADDFVVGLARKMSALRMQCGMVTYDQLCTYTVDQGIEDASKRTRGDAFSTIRYDIHSPTDSRGVVKAYRNMGFMDTTRAPFVNEEIVDVFRDDIHIRGYPYPSPLSTKGGNAYEFSTSTPCVDHTCCVQYAFRPKSRAAPGFVGRFNACESDTTIHSIEMMLVNPYQFQHLDSTRMTCEFTSQQYPWFPTVMTVEVDIKLTVLAGVLEQSVHGSSTSVASGIRCGEDVDAGIVKMYEDMEEKHSIVDKSEVDFAFSLEDQSRNDTLLPELDSAEINRLDSSHKAYQQIRGEGGPTPFGPHGLLLGYNESASFWAAPIVINPSGNDWVWGLRGSVLTRPMNIHGFVYSDLNDEHFAGIDISASVLDSTRIGVSYTNSLKPLQMRLSHRMALHQVRVVDGLFGGNFNYYRQETGSVYMQMSGEHVGFRLGFGLMRQRSTDLDTSIPWLPQVESDSPYDPFLQGSFTWSTIASASRYQSDYLRLSFAPTLVRSAETGAILALADWSVHAVWTPISTPLGPIDVDFKVDGQWTSSTTSAYLLTYSGRRVPLSEARDYLLTTEVAALGGAWKQTGDVYLRTHELLFRLLGIHPGRIGVPLISAVYGVGHFATSYVAGTGPTLVQEVGFAIDRIPMIFTGLYTLGAEMRWPIGNVNPVQQSFGWVLKAELGF